MNKLSMSKLNDEEIKIMTSHAFAQILSSQTDNIGFSALSYCPLQLIKNNLMLGHLARNNSLIKQVKDNPMVKVIFNGPHGYISPRWHSEQVVPTWNYATVSLVCRLNFVESSADKLNAMETISHYFDPQWDFNQFNQEKNRKMVEQMLTAIEVFTLDIIEVKSQFKLSQNRSIACRTAFQENLQLTGYNELAQIQLL